MKDVSLVLPTFARPEQFRETVRALVAPAWNREHCEFLVVNDGGAVCIADELHPFADLDMTYWYLDSGGHWKNPGRAMNVGLRMARSPVTVLCHSGIVPAVDAVQEIHAAVTCNGDTAVLARIEENGVEVSGSHHPYFLFGGMRTEHFQTIRGYDEDFTGYGYEDDDLAVRLSAKGVQFAHRSDITGVHLQHPRGCCTSEMGQMGLLYHQKVEDLRAGRITVVRNLNREWGATS